MSTASEFNASQLAIGALTWDHVTELVRYWQAGHHPLEVDGMAGPATIASIDLPAEMRVGADHWLVGARHMPIDTSWYGGPIHGPGGIVAHYTATSSGTSVAMAKNRQRPFDRARDRAASWHLTIDTDGSVIQMVPLDRIAWHAGGASALPVRGLGSANGSCIGIELVGHGDVFPAAQVEAAKRVWRALVRRYQIAREHAMLEHAKIDPTRRGDPGPVWMGQYANAVLAAAFA